MANFWSQRGNTALHQTTIYQLHSRTSLFRDKMSAEWQLKGHDCACGYRTSTERNSCKCFLKKVPRYAYGQVHLLKQTTIISSFNVMSFNSKHVMIAAPQSTWGLTTFLLSTHSLHAVQKMSCRVCQSTYKFKASDSSCQLLTAPNSHRAPHTQKHSV